MVVIQQQFVKVRAYVCHSTGCWNQSLLCVANDMMKNALAVSVRNIITVDMATTKKLLTDKKQEAPLSLKRPTIGQLHNVRLVTTG